MRTFVANPLYLSYLLTLRWTYAHRRLVQILPPTATHEKNNMWSIFDDITP